MILYFLGTAAAMAANMSGLPTDPNASCTGAVQAKDSAAKTQIVISSECSASKQQQIRVTTVDSKNRKDKSEKNLKKIAKNDVLRHFLILLHLFFHYNFISFMNISIFFKIHRVYTPFIVNISICISSSCSYYRDFYSYFSQQNVYKMILSFFSNYSTCLFIFSIYIHFYFPCLLPQRLCT